MIAALVIAALAMLVTGLESTSGRKVGLTCLGMAKLLLSVPPEPLLAASTLTQIQCLCPGHPVLLLFYCPHDDWHHIWHIFGGIVGIACW